MAAEQFSFYATSAKGLEALLADEIKKMGATSVEIGRAGVSFDGPLEVGYRACLWSRIANRVLLPLKTFPAADPDRLYAGVRSIHWKDHLTVRDTLAVDFSSSHSQITHTHFGALKAKDAIVDQFRTTQGERPSVDPVNPDLRINIYVHEDVATVSLDLSGESLHRRGYRQEGVAAPLKENLGAALLQLMDWPKGEAAAFLDPMCGSGTLPIEAAMMSANIAPGILRERFGFHGWQGHVPALWKRLRAEAKELEIKDKKKLPKIVGYDADYRVVRVALANLEKIGLQGKVHIEKRDFAGCERIAEKGVILLNPPYGERLGDVDHLKDLYKSMGDTFKQKFKGWSGGIFTGSSVLSKVIGLKPTKRIVLYNGAIECRLLKYDLY